MNLAGLPVGDRLMRALPYLATAAILIGMVNFFWYIAESTTIGTAAQGKIVDGHYFLGNKGTFTEVDQAAWMWSQFHGASVFITHPLAIAAMAFLGFRRVFPAMMAGSVSADSELARARIELVRSSGPLIASATMGGRIGGVSMTAPFLEVSVFPKGMIVRAKLMSEHVILAAEVLDVAQRRPFFQQLVEITHLGMGSKSPLRLYTTLDDPIVVALREVVANEASTVPRERPAPTRELAATGPPPVLANPEIDERAEPAGLGGWSLSGEPAVPGLEPRWLGTVLEVAGLGVGAFLLVSGILWAIPKLGLFGVLWTVGATAFLLWNGSTFVRRHFFPPSSEPPAGAPRA